MTGKMSINAMVCAIVLALSVVYPKVAHSGCFDECSPLPPPANVHHGAGSSGAATGTLEWVITSNSPFKAAIKFYSETRRGHEWPSVREMWLLNDHAAHKFRLGCVHGEKICFGAWTMPHHDVSWGVGHGATLSCQNCCHTCGDNARAETLEP
jgi:hypothetical protein